MIKMGEVKKVSSNLGGNCNTQCQNSKVLLNEQIPINKKDIKEQNLFSMQNDLDLPLFKLPQFELFDKIDKDEVNQPQISDLCLKDRQRIGRLVEEVARYKKEKEDDEKEISFLKTQIKEIEGCMVQLRESQNAKMEHSKQMELKHFHEEKKLREKLSELSVLLVEMQKQKETTDKCVKAVRAQAEKLTEALQTIQKEKQLIEKLYMCAKEELKMKKPVKDRMKGQYTVNKFDKNKTEEKSCQFPEKETSVKICTSLEEDTKKELKLINQNKYSEESHDLQLLDELFFKNNVFCNQDEPLNIPQGYDITNHNNYG
uniref:Uncharacterized protein n=1 Tax=Clastoptera arizonana TaxID=38151 RepID=A0A1B6CS10_9HEMI